jgi:hypothetical protein
MDERSHSGTEHFTAGFRGSSIASCAVQVPGLIDYQAALGSRAVTSGMALEGEQRGFRPSSTLGCWRGKLARVNSGPSRIRSLQAVFSLLACP